MPTRLKLLWVRLRPYTTFATLVYGLLAGLFGPIPLLSLLQKIFRVWNWKLELLGLPRFLLEEYQRLRAAALKPVVDLLKTLFLFPDWLTDILTTWVADLLAIYMLFVISVVRGSVVDRRSDRLKFKNAPDSFRQQLRAAALLHGRDPQKLIAEVEAGLGTGLMAWLRFQWRIWIGSLKWPFVIRRNVVQLQTGIASDLAFTRVAMWTLMLTCAVAGAVVYLSASFIAR